MKTATARRLRAAVAGLAMIASAPQAFAACFELVGCTDSEHMSWEALNQLSCDALWTVRNTIFDENGYCFQSERGKANFSNAGCLYKSSGDAPLNSYESANVQTVLAVENARGCLP